MRKIRRLFGIAVLFGAVLFTGCNEPTLSQKRAEDGGSGGAATTTGEGGEGGDLFAGGGGSLPVCVGACVPGAASPFSHITMLSIAPPDKILPCPEWAPDIGFEGYANIAVAPHTCPECSCGPASCTLPEEMFVSAAKCPGEGASFIEWNAPPAWEGVCSSESPISAGLQCEGVACVQSLTIEALHVEPCKPNTQGIAALPSPEWETLARECKINTESKGTTDCPHGRTCAPLPPEGFTLCISVAGDDPGYECPKEYPSRWVMFDGAVDSRECSRCECGEPEALDCTALVSAYSDGDCGQVVASVMVATDQGACVDLLNGTGLGSKSASFIVDKPGTCKPSGGEPSGAVEPAGAVTFCCQQVDPEPPK